ncbi:MAG TPA: hypothetical protein VFM18_03840, partial [Methanosarcina sp.]|nr:hypothetical protein [Methanosarcina sp.]
MPDIKISDMTTATAFSGSDVVPIVEAGTNKKVTATNFFANIQDPVVVNSLNEDNDTVIKGMTDSQLVYVDASTNRVGFSTNTPLTLVHVDGDITLNGVEYNGNYDTQTASGTLNLTTRSTIVDSSSAVAIQLGNGTFPGQEKTILRKGSGSVTISATGTIIGGSTITLNAAGSAVTVRYLNSAWYITGG